MRKLKRDGQTDTDRQKDRGRFNISWAFGAAGDNNVLYNTSTKSSPFNHTPESSESIWKWNILGSVNRLWSVFSISLFNILIVEVLILVT